MPSLATVGGAHQLAGRIDQRCLDAGVHLNRRAIQVVLDATAAELRAAAGAAYALEEEDAGRALQAIAGLLEDAAR